MLPGKDFFSLADIQIQIVCQRVNFDKIARHSDIMSTGNKKAREIAGFLVFYRWIYFLLFLFMNSR